MDPLIILAVVLIAGTQAMLLHKLMLFERQQERLHALIRSILPHVHIRVRNAEGVDLPVAPRWSVIEEDGHLTPADESTPQGE